MVTAEGQLRELCDSFITAEELDDGDVHTVLHESLLGQLNTVTTLDQNTTGEVFHSTPKSKPAGRLDAVALLQRVDQESEELCHELGVHPVPVFMLDRLAHIRWALRDGRPNSTVASWWVAARILTGLDGPPMTPNVPCEHCLTRGGLKVQARPQGAVCTSCGKTWDEATFGGLVGWVRWASEHLNGPKHLVPRPVPGYPEELGYTWPHEQVECEEDECVRLRHTRRLSPRADQVPVLSVAG